MAAYNVQERALTQKDRLLVAFTAHPEGLTDEEAATIAGLPIRSCWWKRCSELREAGLIEHTEQMRLGSAGCNQLVSRITINKENTK